MQTPQTKLAFKKLINSKVVDYWESYLRAGAAPLTSLLCFKPSYMSLLKPHAIWWTAGRTPMKFPKLLSNAGCSVVDTGQTNYPVTGLKVETAAVQHLAAKEKLRLWYICCLFALLMPVLGLA